MTAILLLGVVIGRLTVTQANPDDVYLRNSEPKLLAEASATPTDSISTDAAGKPRGRTALVPVTREVTGGIAPAAGQSTPSAKPRPRNTTIIEGSFGRDDQGTSTFSGEEHVRGDGHLAAVEGEVVELVNAERAKRGCAPLRVDQRLVQSARMHSNEMAANDSFQHESPDGSTPWKRMESVGYTAGGAENIARGYQTAAEAVHGWMASRTHRANILNCRLAATGVGVSLGPGGPWWTQDFGYS